MTRREIQLLATEIAHKVAPMVTVKGLAKETGLTESAIRAKNLMKQ